MVGSSKLTSSTMGATLLKPAQRNCTPTALHLNCKPLMAMVNDLKRPYTFRKHINRGQPVSWDTMAGLDNHQPPFHQIMGMNRSFRTAYHLQVYNRLRKDLQNIITN